MGKYIHIGRLLFSIYLITICFSIAVTSLEYTSKGNTSHREAFREHVISTILPDNKKLSSFQFSFQLSTESNPPPFFSLFPSEFYDLLYHNHITDLSLSLTQGFWDSTIWGQGYDAWNLSTKTLRTQQGERSIPHTTPFPAGAVLDYSHEFSIAPPLEWSEPHPPGSTCPRVVSATMSSSPSSSSLLYDSLTSSTRYIHTDLVSSLGALFCSALSQIDHSKISIHHNYRQYKTHVNTVLPIESLCTDNISTLNTLSLFPLPIPQATTLFASQYISVRFDAHKISSSSSSNIYHTTISLTFVRSIHTADTPQNPSTDIAYDGSDIIHRFNNDDAIDPVSYNLSAYMRHFKPNMQALTRTFAPTFLSQDHKTTYSQDVISSFTKHNVDRHLKFVPKAYLGAPSSSSSSSSKTPQEEQQSSILHDFLLWFNTGKTIITLNNNSSNNNNNIMMKSTFYPTTSILYDITRMFNTFISEPLSINTSSYRSSLSSFIIPKWHCTMLDHLREQSSSESTTKTSPTSHHINSCGSHLLSLLGPGYMSYTTRDLASRPLLAPSSLPDILELFSLSTSSSHDATNMQHNMLLRHFLILHTNNILNSWTSPSSSSSTASSSSASSSTASSLHPLATLMSPYGDIIQQFNTLYDIELWLHKYNIITYTLHYLSQGPQVYNHNAVLQYNSIYKDKQQHSSPLSSSSSSDTNLTKTLNHEPRFTVVPSYHTISLVRLFTSDHRTSSVLSPIMYPLLSTLVVPSPDSRFNSIDTRQTYLPLYALYQHSAHVLLWNILALPASSTLQLALTPPSNTYEKAFKNIQSIHPHANNRCARLSVHYPRLSFIPRALGLPLSQCHPTRFTLDTLMSNIYVTRYFSAHTLHRSAFEYDIIHSPSPALLSSLHPSAPPSSTPSSPSSQTLWFLGAHEVTLPWQIGDILHHDITLKRSISSSSSSLHDISSDAISWSTFDPILNHHFIRSSQRDECQLFTSLTSTLDTILSQSRDIPSPVLPLYSLSSEKLSILSQCSHVHIIFGKRHQSHTIIRTFYLFSGSSSSSSSSPSPSIFHVSIPIIKQVYRVADAPPDIARGLDIPAGLTVIMPYIGTSSTHKSNNNDITPLKCIPDPNITVKDQSQLDTVATATTKTTLTAAVQPTTCYIIPYTSYNNNTVMPVPYPDASMPFNVTAVVSTLAAFFFGSMFNLLYNSNNDFIGIQKRGKLMAIIDRISGMTPPVQQQQPQPSKSQHTTQEHDEDDRNNTIASDTSTTVLTSTTAISDSSQDTCTENAPQETNVDARTTVA